MSQPESFTENPSLTTAREAVVPPRIGRTSMLIAVALWGLMISAGFAIALVHEITPAKSKRAKDLWPTGSSCTLAPDCPTLVMFVHPKCPCSRASLQELALLMTHCQSRVNAQVLFFEPPSAAANWAQTDLWETAATIPGVTVKADVQGVEFQRFRARVSGEVFLYQPNGELAFHGGITGGRGHAGDNLGRATVEAILRDQSVINHTTPVFGCELQSPDLEAKSTSAAATPRAKP